MRNAPWLTLAISLVVMCTQLESPYPVLVNAALVLSSIAALWCLWRLRISLLRAISALVGVIFLVLFASDDSLAALPGLVPWHAFVSHLPHSLVWKLVCGFTSFLLIIWTSAYAFWTLCWIPDEKAWEEREDEGWYGTGSEFDCP